MVNKIATTICLLSVLLSTAAAQEMTAYDIDEAADICASLPLSPIEGIWIYPEDNVTVMVLRDTNESACTLPTYTISAVESTDCRITPGDVIGSITTTAQPGTYEITLFTKKAGEIFQEPKQCLATLSKDSETLILKKGKGKFSLRFSLNINRLLPGFWKILRIGVSSKDENSNVKSPVGMVKIFPSYDGNGSSRRQPRYL